jgi:pimeloyl-ACP methyl ester carboxylesterase
MVHTTRRESGSKKRYTMHQPNEVAFGTIYLATGVRLHYAEQGDLTGEAIVFLHAYVDSWYWFSRVLTLLLPEYHAFAPDQRGHGDSERPECCYTVDDRNGVCGAPQTIMNPRERVESPSHGRDRWFEPAITHPGTGPYVLENDGVLCQKNGK